MKFGFVAPAILAGFLVSGTAFAGSFEDGLRDWKSHQHTQTKSDHRDHLGAGFKLGTFEETSKAHRVEETGFVSSIPEPGTSALMLVGVGLMCLIAYRRRVEKS